MSMKQLLIVACIICFSVVRARQFTIMIDPAGDAKVTGRQLDDNFERGITLQCVQRLQQIIEASMSDVRIIITRMPGETITELQNANFANRMAVDLYLSIHFYKEQEAVPSWYFYTYDQSDTTIIKPAQLAFYTYDKVYLINQHITKEWALLIKNTLEKSIFSKYFQYKGIFSLPFKPLAGIKVPAIAFEIGLKNKDSWLNCVDPLFRAIQTIVLKEQATV